VGTILNWVSQQFQDGKFLIGFILLSLWAIVFLYETIDGYKYFVRDGEWTTRHFVVYRLREGAKSLFAVSVVFVMLLAAGWLLTKIAIKP
jgi:hypothetical protein